MDFTHLTHKKDFIAENIDYLSETAKEKYSKSFEIEYAHHSTAIEGNTLTLIETKLLLEDKLSVGNKELREIYEVTNHNKAFAYVSNRIQCGKPLDENAVKDIHSILMENIIIGGVYRCEDVYISGSQHVPPTPNVMYQQIKHFYAFLQQSKHAHAIEIAAWTHAEFVKIHPFIDGNGRVSRLIMNYQLMHDGYLPISIPKEERLNYYECLESYAMSGDLQPFISFIAQLEEKRLDCYISSIQAAKNTQKK